jgi:dihydrodipicolinate synthase/N-acetylneuraminate lyase
VTGGRPRGTLAAVPTPFDRTTGDLAVHQLRDNVARLLAAGLDGIVVAGSTGEAPLLDPDEQRRLVAAVRGVLPDGRWLVAGAGAESRRQSIALARAAASEGADVVLVRPPAYYASALTAAGLLDHYRAVADASPVPVLVYNIPRYTHLSLAAGLVQQLGAHGNVAGAKDSSGSLKTLAAYRAALPQASVLVGPGALLYGGLELGCDGGILAVACYAAVQCVELTAAFRAGDRARAGALQERIGPLDRVVGRLGPAGVKLAMDLVGLYGGPCRPPLAAVPERERARVARLLAA